MWRNRNSAYCVCRLEFLNTSKVFWLFSKPLDLEHYWCFFETNLNISPASKTVKLTIPRVIFLCDQDQIVEMPVLKCFPDQYLKYK